MEKICPVCGKVFETIYKAKVYCSGECAQENALRKKRANWNKPHSAVCPVCGVEFIWTGKRRRYCSKTCYRKANRERVGRSRAKVKRQKKLTTLDEAAAAARREGLSYGQWMQKHFFD